MRREILRLAWPVLVGQLAVMFNGLIDTVMAGRLSAIDLAAVGLASSIYVSSYVGLMGVLVALTPIAAQHYGAGQFREIGADTRQALLLALAMSAGGALLIAQTDWWLRMAQPPAEVAPVLRGYLYAVAAGLPAALLFRVFQAMNNAIARPKVVMMINLAGLLLKVPLNLVFMNGLGWIPAMGGAGCGVATAVISWLSAAAALWLMLRDRTYDRYQLKGSMRPQWRRLADILSLGIPISISYLIEVTSFTAMAILVARFGAVTSASHQIAANVVSLAYMFALAFAVASSTLTGHALGAGDLTRARRTAMYGLRLTVGVALIIGCTIALLREPISRLYAADPVVASAAAALLAWAALFHVFDAAQCTLSFCLRAYRIANLPTVVYALALWGIGVGLGWWLAFVAKPAGMTPTGAFWAAGTLGVFVAALGLGALLWRVFMKSKRQINQGT